MVEVAVLRAAVCAIMLAAFIAGCSNEPPPKDATLLPIVHGPFKQGNLEVYELSHGWLVRRDAPIGEFTFVPKSGKLD